MQGCIKCLSPPALGGGGYHVCWGRISVVKRRKENHVYGKEYNVGKRESESNIILPVILKAVGKNVKWERREGEGHFREENQDFLKKG